MPKFELHCLYWENANPEMVRLHRDCLHHIGVDVIYTNKSISHGHWITQLANERLEDLDAIGFIDIDCLPYSAEAVAACRDYSIRTGSFVGLAQAANHITPQLPVYAAPSFLVISRSAFRELGKPTLWGGARVDVAQNLSLTANALGFPYRLLYPTGFNRTPEGGAWRLGNYGWYGIGTEFDGGFFHLYQSTEIKSFDLFRDKAAAIIAGTAQPNAPINTRDFALQVDRSAPTGRRKYRVIRKFFRQY